MAEEKVNGAPVTDGLSAWRDCAGQGNDRIGKGGSVRVLRCLWFSYFADGSDLTGGPLMLTGPLNLF